MISLHSSPAGPAAPQFISLHSSPAGRAAPQLISLHSPPAGRAAPSVCRAPVQAPDSRPMSCVPALPASAVAGCRLWFGNGCACSGPPVLPSSALVPQQTGMTSLVPTVKGDLKPKTQRELKSCVEVEVAVVARVRARTQARARARTHARTHARTLSLTYNYVHI